MEDRARSVLNLSHDAFIGMDAAGVIVDWNPAAERIFGYSSQEAVGRLLADLIIPERLRAAHWNGLERFLATGEGQALNRRLEVSGLTRDGREFPVELAISVDRSGEEPLFYAFLRDISSRKLAEMLLRAQSAIAHGFAASRDADDAMVRLLGGLGEALGWQIGAWWSVDHERDCLQCRGVWQSAPDVVPDFDRLTKRLSLPRGVGLPGRVWASGLPLWVSDVTDEAQFLRAQAAARAGLCAAIGVPVAADGAVTDVIEYFSEDALVPDESMQEILVTIAAQIGGFVKLERLSLVDELTGLPNRRAWQEALERELSRAAREQEPVCVAMLDLDNFKRFNDTHGHQAGDELLIEAARMWKSRLRKTDVITRYGGEEFALALPGQTIEDAQVILERLRTATPRGQTSSLGVAEWNGRESAEELVGRADSALYEAKAQGRDRTALAA